MGEMRPDRPRVPNLFRAGLGIFDIMQKTIIADKSKHAPPNLYVRPKIVGVDILEFFTKPRRPTSRPNARPRNCGRCWSKKGDGLTFADSKRR